MRLKARVVLRFFVGSSDPGTNEILLHKMIYIKRLEINEK
jgi:hypothetical protein